jgi:DNA gyrase/topoisomerase IV subunit B
VLSVKLRDPQFSGQTKEKLTSRQCAAFIFGVVEDAFSLWLNQHVALGEKLVEMACRFKWIAIWKNLYFGRCRFGWVTYCYLTVCLIF